MEEWIVSFSSDWDQSPKKQKKYQTKRIYWMNLVQVIFEFFIKQLNKVKRVLTVLRPFNNWSCISTWTQTLTGWTDKQEGWKKHRHYTNTQDTDIQTDNMFSAWMMHTAAGFCVFVCFRCLYQRFFSDDDISNRFTWY